MFCEHKVKYFGWIPMVRNQVCELGSKIEISRSKVFQLLDLVADQWGRPLSKWGKIVAFVRLCKAPGQMQGAPKTTVVPISESSKHMMKIAGKTYWLKKFLVQKHLWAKFFFLYVARWLSGPWMGIGAPRRLRETSLPTRLATALGRERSVRDGRATHTKANTKNK